MAFPLLVISPGPVIHFVSRARSWWSSPGEREHPCVKASHLGSAPMVHAAWLHRDEAESENLFVKQISDASYSNFSPPFLSSMQGRVP